MGKFWDTVKRLFNKDEEEQQQDNSASNNTGADTAAANQQQTPQQQQPVYKNNSVVYQNPENGTGLYQYQSPDPFKSQDEVDEQWKYAGQLGLTRDQAIDMLKNGTRWKNVVLGQNGRPIISYQGDKYKSQEEVNEQWAIAGRLGYTRDEAIEAIKNGIHWREQTEDDVWNERRQETSGNAAKDIERVVGGDLSNANERASSIYGNQKYRDILNADDFAEKSKAQESKKRTFGGDELYDYINNIGDARKQSDMRQQRFGDNDNSKYLFMNEDEVGIYNYLYQTKGKKAAKDFLESIEPELNAQQYSSDIANWSDFATENAGNAAFVSALTVAAEPVRSLTSVAANAQDAISTIRGEEIDPNSNLRQLSNRTADVRQAIGEDIKKEVTSRSGKTWGNVAQFGYQTAMSALDSTVNALVAAGAGGIVAGPGTDAASLKVYQDASNKIGAALMSSEVMSQSVRESKLKGYSNLGALTLGLTRGGIEYLSEKIGGDWIIKKARDNPASYFNTLIHAMIPEGVEEVMSDIGNEGVNLLIDALFGTEESFIGALRAELEAQGFKGADLYWEMLKHIGAQEALSFAGGAFAAFGSGSRTYIGNSSAINGAASALNTDRAGIVDLYNELKSNNENEDIDIGAINTFAQLYDISSIDEFREKVAEFKSLSDAIEQKLIAQGTAEDEPENTGSFDEYEETFDDGVIPQYREAVYEANGYQTLSDEQLGDYAKHLQSTLETLNNMQTLNYSEDNIDAITDYEEELNEVVQEQARRQTERETAEKAAKEAAKTNKQTANNEPVNIESTPSEEYNGTVETTEGATDNGSNQGNPEGDNSYNARQAPGSAGQLVVESGDGESVGEDTTIRRLAAESKESGDRESAETRTADTATESTGEQRNAGNRTVQGTISEERSGRVTRIFDAVHKHFGIDSFKKSQSRYYGNVQNLGKFSMKALSRVFGSQKTAAQFTNNWMADSTTSIYMSPALTILNKGDLKNDQRRSAYTAFCMQQIMRDLYDGNFTAQDIADIGGIDLAEAENILANAEQNLNKAMAGQRILNQDGSVKTFPFRQESNEQARQSGANNTVANIASGEKPGTAQTFELTEKYTTEKGDKEVKTSNKYGNKIYQRDNSYLVVNKGGYVIAKLAQGEETDMAEVMRKAHAVANKSSASYGVASVRLFGKDVYFNDETGMVLNTGSIFTKNNMIDVQRSLASDEMHVAYSDMERGSKKGTSAWFKLNLGVEREDDIGSLTNATVKIRDLIRVSMAVDDNGHRGVRMSNGKYYVFFGMTANGAKKGEAIMVSEEYYDNLRTKSLAGKTEAEVKQFNPAKYLTASASIFSPSNNDTGIKIAPKGKDGKRHPQVAVIGDVYTTRIDTLRRYMRVDNELDNKALTESFTKTMTRKLKAQGLSQAQIDEEIAKADIPGQVKQIIDNSTVGSVINIMTDVMFQATDGTGFVDLPESSPYEGQSIQMRSLGGFKAQLVGFKFSDYLHDVIPFSSDAEYLYHGENGEIAGGFRYQDKDVGVEVLSYWGTQRFDDDGNQLPPLDEDWIPVKDLRAILFNSTVKFAGQFGSTEEFYEKTGDADLRSIPRENVYGVSVSDSTFEGYRLRGLGQLLRSQFNFTDDEVRSVLSNRLDEVIDSIQANPRAAAKMFGVDFDGPAPSKADGKAYAIWLHGPSFMNTWDGKRWVAEKLGQLVKDMRSGDFPFKFDEQAFGWVDPDAAGLIHAMTAITRINGEISDTEGGGFGLDGYAGLTPGQIFNANLGNENNSRTVVGRFPSTKATDVQIRQNVDKNNPAYKKMVEKYGLDKGNIYVAINDTLSMYLDNDYDGDPVISFQGALAELMEKIRSRDFTDKDGKPLKTNAFVATAKGIQNQEVEGADRGPVEFSHAKAEKVDLIAKNIGDAVHAYLSVNDNTNAEHKGPRPVGMYDNMVERLAAIPNSMLEKPAKEAGMTVKEYRAQLEATFGVAYVLSIDYAKTGREFKEFFTLVERLDGMLYDIAEENGLIAARDLDKSGNKITNNDSFVPSWWENSNSVSKQAKFASAKEKGNVANNPNTLLSAINRLLPEKARKEGGGFASWYDTFKERLGKGSRERPNWAGAMTASPESYKQYSNNFFDSLSKLYREITADNNPEFQKLKKAYENAGRDVKDVDIRNYLVYKHIQQGLNLTNEQFTDLMLMMLTKNGGSSGVLLNYDQNQYDKSNTQLSTKDIIQRNIKLTKTYEQSVNALGNIYTQVSSASRALIKARENISQLLDSKKTTLNAVDASRVARIADMQNYLEAGNKRLQQSLDDLTTGVKNKAKAVDADTIDGYRTELENMLGRINELKQQLNSNDSVFVSGIATDTKNIYGDVTRQVRDALRQVNTLERSLNQLYDAYSRQANVTGTATEDIANSQFWQAETGLEGLSEQDILNKIGENKDADRSVQSDNSRRENVQRQDAGRRGTERRGSSSENQGKQETGAARQRTEEKLKVDSANKDKIQSRPSVRGDYDLATNSDGETLSAHIGDNDSRFTVTTKDKDGKVKVKEEYKLDKGGRLITKAEMTPQQRATLNILSKFGIHVVYTTSNIAVTKGKAKDIGTVTTGFTFRGQDVNTGERFIVVNIAANDGIVTSRHEPIHAFFDMLGKGNALKWMTDARDKLIADKGGYIKLGQYNKAVAGLPTSYKSSTGRTLNEFFANLFSGDSFYDSMPGLAEQFMRNGLDEYNRTGRFPFLSDLIDQAMPTASDEDKATLLSFFTDPYTDEPAIFAREASDSSVEEETATETQPATEKQTEEIKPLPFGERRKAVAKSAVKIQSLVDGSMKGLAGNDSRKARKYAKVLRNFNNTVKMMLKGKATTEELYTAYGGLKGTIFHDETVDPYFDALINKNQYINEDAFNEAVEHALAKFTAYAANAVNAEDTNTRLGNEAKKYDNTGLKKAVNFMGSWQLNAPTFFKALMGYKRGTSGYEVGESIRTANKNLQQNYWKAYQPIERVAQMNGFRELINGDTTVDIGTIQRRISSVEAINLLRMLKTVEYTQGDLSNVKGFTLSNGEKIRTATKVGRYTQENASDVREELEDYFEHRASAVEKAYYKAMDSVFDAFTSEVRRVGTKLNGYVDVIPSDQYSPISWGKGSLEENFDPQQAQLKTDPKYMKSRVEEAGGYLYAAPMSDVIEAYIRRMSDYLAFGELREQLRIMNKTAEFRQSKTLGQIAGENMGEDYARFINNYVRDIIHYSENSDSFWYKLRSNMQKGVLVGNPSVMMKQSASILNAASVIDMKYLIQALGPNKFRGNYAKGKSGLLEYRRITGNFDPTITDIFGQKASKIPFVRWFKNGISIIDYEAVKTIYIGACLQTEAQGISRNSPNFDSEVEKLFSEAAIDTQPQFDPSLRPENARTKNEGVRMLSMFRTQQSQNFNKLVTAIGEYQANNNATTRKQLKGTISGLVGSSMMLAVFTAVADAILHRKRKYKDDDDEITATSVMSRLGIGAAEALAGTAWFGDDAAKFIIDQLGVSNTQEFYGLSMGPVSTIYDAATSLGKFITALKEGKNYVNAGKKFITYATQTLGIPANNAYNYVNAVAMYALDHMGENPDDYDDLTKWLDNNLKAQRQLIKAAEAGNEKKTNKMWQTLQKRYAEPKEQLNKQLKTDYQRGKVSDETAENLLIVYGGLEDKEAAQKRIAKWNFDEEYPEYKDDMSESYVWKWQNEVKPTGANLDTYVKAVKYFKEINKDKDNGKDSQDMLVYLNKLNLTDEQRAKIYSTFGSVLYQQFKSDEGFYKKYENYAKPNGISTEDFITYYNHFNELTGDKDKNGKTIPYSKQNKVIKYINSLPLNKKQKDALWKSFNYSTTSKAWKTRPWK